MNGVAWSLNGPSQQHTDTHPTNASTHAMHLTYAPKRLIPSLPPLPSWPRTPKHPPPNTPRPRSPQDYTDRIKEAQEKTGLQDGVRTGTGLLHGIPVALGVMDFPYMGGSMGSVVGEKLTRLIEYATQEGMPVIIVCASGGARMQEGIFSLMQVAGWGRDRGLGWGAGAGVGVGLRWGGWGGRKAKPPAW